MRKLLTFSILAATLVGSTGCTTNRSLCDTGCGNPAGGCCSCFNCFRRTPRQPEVYCAPAPQAQCCDPCATSGTMLAPQMLAAPVAASPVTSGVIMAEPSCNCQ